MNSKKYPIGKEFSKEDYSLAIRKIRFHDKLHENYSKMLQVHYDMPERKISPVQLAEALNYMNYTAVNLHYGILGKMICDELGYVPEDLTSQGDPNYTCGIAWGERETPESEWTWTMYDNLAQALKELGIVK